MTSQNMNATPVTGFYQNVYNGVPGGQRFAFVSEGKTVLECQYPTNVEIETPPSDAAIAVLLIVGFLGAAWLLTRR